MSAAADDGKGMLGVRTRHLAPLVQVATPVGGEVASDADPVRVPSRPGTVVWGELPAAGTRAAVIEVASGTTLDVDTVSHHLMSDGRDPRTAFAELGIAPSDVLEDVVDIHHGVERAPGGSPHVLTGPIAVSGARPGDVLEVRILEATVRVPYGINRGRPGAGLLPDLLDDVAVRLFTVDPDGQHLQMGAVGRVPLAPFPGIVTLTPPGSAPGSDLPGGRRSARGVGRWGGNLDLRQLTVGSALFLPVHVDGAGLYLGDPHSAQGDGEANGTGVEHSCSFRIALRLHHDVPASTPVVSTPTHWIATGIDRDLTRALELATAAAVDLLVGLSDDVLSTADAYALCGAGVDLRIAEAVNGEQLVYAMIPRAMLLPPRRPHPEVA